jgi:transcriptional regulator
MYIPKDFEQNDAALMKALIESNPLGTMVLSGSEGLIANHIPFEVKATSSKLLLLGHVAKANSISLEFGEDTDVLIVFSGENSYISPSWYPSKKTNKNVVPTWNYMVVHAHGRVRTVDDAEWLQGHVQRLTDREESALAQPWSVSHAPADFTDRLLGAIVGIEVEVTRLEGKWKLSQNKSQEDRRGVIRGLRERRDPRAGLLADRMEGLAPSFEE